MPKYDLFESAEAAPKRHWQLLRMSYCLINAALMWNGFIIAFSTLVGCSRWPLYLRLGTISTLLTLGMCWIPAALIVYFSTRRKQYPLLAPNNRLALASLSHAFWFAIIGAISAISFQPGPSEQWLLASLFAVVTVFGILSIGLLYLSILYRDWMSICRGWTSRCYQLAHGTAGASIGCGSTLLIEPESKAGIVASENLGNALPGIDVGDTP